MFTLEVKPIVLYEYCRAGFFDWFMLRLCHENINLKYINEIKLKCD